MASSFTNLLYHVVFSTRHRQPLITPSLQPDLYAYIGGIVRNHEGILLEAGGIADHIHLLAKLSPKLAVVDVLRDLKAGSSKWVNERSESSLRFEWQTGYAAFTVSCSQVETVRRYLQNQEEHHRTRSFKDEYLTLLKRHEIQYEERYVFEEEHSG